MVLQSIRASRRDWQCRLYGHLWRHPGDHEVIVSPTGKKYLHLCPVCGRRAYLDERGNSVESIDAQHRQPGETPPARPKRRPNQ